MNWSGFDPVPIFLPILIKAAKAVLDAVIDGAELNDWQRGLVRWAYWGVKEFYDNIVYDPDNTYTDEILDAFVELCEDTAEEGGWSLEIGV
jgi:hypothetical protein